MVKFTNNVRIILITKTKILFPCNDKEGEHDILIPYLCLLPYKTNEKHNLLDKLLCIYICVCVWLWAIVLETCYVVSLGVFGE